MDRQTLAARFGYVQLVEQIGRLRDKAQGDGDLDRRVLIAQLCQELGVDEAALLERGFDKAYRRIVEGV